MKENITDFTFEKIEDGYRLVSYQGKKKQIEIPDEYEGEKVTEIAPHCFEGKKENFEVIFPKGLLRIKEGAFAHSSIKALDFPYHVVEIGKEAFEDCQELKEVHLPETLEVLGEQAFADCHNLSGITIHENIKSFGEKVFANDTELVIRLPDFVEEPKQWGEHWNSENSQIIYGYVTLRHVDKMYPHHIQAVYDFNLVVKKHDFIVLVGPSGCGKSTTLRMIAGLEDISSGQLFIDGNYSNETQPKDRGIAMVFQSYALYPHMTVRENMAFGLKMRHLTSKEIDERVEKAAQILELEPYLERKPKDLSGGQRQRVALGRAIVRNAKVFLMDEPLSNLDAKLRVQMRSDLIALHEKIGATTIYVTHDQTEAMTMATRIVVMRLGRVQQIGEPREIYNHPANIFVAGFIGAPAMNFIKVKYAQGKITMENGFSFDVHESQWEALKAYEGKEIIMGVRPEHIIEDPEKGYEVEVEVAELLGSEILCHFHIGETKLVAKISSKEEISAHDKIKIHFIRHRLSFFNPETELSILDGNLCVDKTLPNDFIHTRVDAKGVALKNGQGEEVRIKAKPDDLDLMVDKETKEVTLDHISLTAGQEYAESNTHYHLYFSARLVNKILKAASKMEGPISLSIFTSNK